MNCILRLRQSGANCLALALLAILLAACDPTLAPPLAEAPTPELATPTPELLATSAFQPPSPNPSLPSPAAVYGEPSVVATPLPAPTATLDPRYEAPALPPTPTLAPLAADQRRAIFEQVWERVRDRYLYPDYGGLDWQAIRAEFEPRAVEAATPEAFYDAIGEMIGRLDDEHSRFESPQEVAAQQARSAGEWSYGGIGVNIRPHPEGALITRLAPGGPAEAAGLRSRDLILAIGGIVFTDTAAFGVGGPAAAVRGTPGTTVTLTVRSPRAPPREVVLTRRVIPSDAFPPVEARRLAGTNVGLLTIDTFERLDTAERVRAELERLLDAGPLDGLIVDVRDNGGGYIDAMLETLALFVDGGTIGASVGRDREEELTIPRGQLVEPLAGAPMAVLIGADTVSAAEMFAAGMRAAGRARIVGAASAGNTENLLGHTFDDGSRLWLAEYAYRLPDGGLIEGRGVQPDRLISAEWWRFDLEDDPQIRAAIEELRRGGGEGTGGP